MRSGPLRTAPSRSASDRQACSRDHAPPPPTPPATQHGNPARLWQSVTSTQQPLLEALDVLVKRASWRDSISALLLTPVIIGLRHLGRGWLWLTRRQMRAK
jgi:hypothetical protein